MSPPSSSRPTTYVLIPGAGGAAWYWHRVAPPLMRARDEAIAIDLPGDDANTSLSDYADFVVRAIGKRSNVTLVAQSLGGLLLRWFARAQRFDALFS